MFRVFLLVNLVLWCFVCLTGEVSYMYVQTNYINPPPYRSYCRELTLCKTTTRSERLAGVFSA